MEMYSDIALLQALADDLDGNFKLLVDRYSKDLYHFVLRHMDGCKESADDIMQEAWMSVYQTLDQSSGEQMQIRNLRNWLFVVFDHKMSTYANGKKKSSNTQSIDLLLDIEASSTDGQPELIFEGVEYQEEVRAAIESLPLAPESRRALTLHLFDGWSYQEIANRLHLSVNAVKARIYRGRQLLRAALVSSVS